MLFSHNPISNNNKHDYNQMVLNLRIKSNFKMRLNHRLQAIIQGKDAFHKINNEIDDDCALINQ